MNVMLLFPPQWIPHQPHLGLPSLVGFLKIHGIDVSQKDLNVEAYDYFLSRGYLRSLKPRLEERFATINRQPFLLPGMGTKLYADLFLAKSSIKYLADSVEESKAVFRSENYYDGDNLSNARNTLNNALAVISMAHFPTHLDLMSFSMPPYDGTFSSIEALTADRSQNLFIEFFEKTVFHQVREQSPGIIGISIIGETQLIPALTLSRLVKKHFPNTHIVLGGYIVTLLSDIFKKNQQMFGSYFDSLIVLEGELPILRLVQTVEKGEPLSSVPNLIYSFDGKVTENPIITPQPMDSLPPPDFDDLPLNKYLSPEPVLPILATRGCYWAKCAFCSHNISYENKYRAASAEKTIADLIHLADRYKARIFTFTDEAIAPSLMRKLVSSMIEKKLDFRYSTNIRLEPQFDKDLCQIMHNAGFRVVFLGLESGCDRVLGLMHKGFTRDEAYAVCRNLTEAGIWDHLYVFVGFPGEQTIEAEETVRFLFETCDAVKSFNVGAFTLARGSAVIVSPEKYGVTLPSGDASANFSIGFDYKINRGLTRAEALELSDSAWARLIKVYPTRGVLTTISKEDLLLYVSHNEYTDPWLSDIVKRTEHLSQKKAGKGAPLTNGSRPRLSPDVTLTVLNYDLPSLLNPTPGEAAAISQHKTLVVFKASSRRLRPLDRQLWEVLKLCDGTSTLDSITRHLAIKYTAQCNSFKEYCLNTLNALADEGYVIA
ncbi:B12-binding domain-containing radical SAM protein [Dehalogenimonas alkenigignens]|uniref:B12-binding domain-containing radical SAM protein n=1 Tax=Dehalogenimonas alkenigignens TaxID=1217799 RepID=UPI000D56704A|nr:radical SAM protein [Dehalogenimonas alkenigignens]PVV83097.1 B12-binding domain-containing radical SAM protein [Dehalogenimonas alkenigignens]